MPLGAAFFVVLSVFSITLVSLVDSGLLIFSLPFFLIDSASLFTIVFSFLFEVIAVILSLLLLLLQVVELFAEFEDGVLSLKPQFKILIFVLRVTSFETFKSFP